MRQWAFLNSGSGSGGFSPIQTPFGTYPVAPGPLTFTSTDNTVIITGNSTTDTVNFSADAGIFVKKSGDTIEYLDINQNPNLSGYLAFSTPATPAFNPANGIFLSAASLNAQIQFSYIGALGSAGSVFDFNLLDNSVSGVVTFQLPNVLFATSTFALIQSNDYLTITGDPLFNLGYLKLPVSSGGHGGHPGSYTPLDGIAISGSGSDNYLDFLLTNGWAGTFDFTHLTTDRVWAWPDKTGTVAMTSDIPVISGYVLITGDTMSGTLINQSSSTTCFWASPQSNVYGYLGTRRVGQTVDMIRLETEGISPRWGVSKDFAIWNNLTSAIASTCAAFGNVTNDAWDVVAIKAGIGTQTGYMLKFLDKNGSTIGGFDAALRLYGAGGTNSLPGFSFTADPDTGMYSSTSNVLGFATAGVVGFTLDANQKVNLKASTTAAAPIIIPAGTAPTSPVEGDIWNDSTQKAHTTFVDGLNQKLSSCIFTQTADATVTNTVTETSILGTGVGTKTLPANFLVAGKSVRIRVGGVYSTPIGTPSIVIKVKLGTTVIATVTTTSLLASASSLEFDGEVFITCRTTGASGTVMTHGDIEYATGITGTIAVDSLNNGGATTTVDTTASKAIDVTVTWDSATSTRIVKSTVCEIEVLN